MSYSYTLHVMVDYGLTADNIVVAASWPIELPAAVIEASGLNGENILSFRNTLRRDIYSEVVSILGYDVPDDIIRQYNVQINGVVNRGFVPVFGIDSDKLKLEVAHFIASRIEDDFGHKLNPDLS